MSRVLQAAGIHVAFDGVVALDGAAVAVRPGVVTGLIGRNGSGKTTLFNCITGFVRPQAGAITIDGLDITLRAPSEIVACGVARTFQTPRVDFRTTVHEAVCAGAFATVSSGFVSAVLGLPRARRDESALRRRAEEMLCRFDLESFAHAEVGTLSMGRLRIVEVARALAANARYLLLDEPAAGISHAEQVLLARELRKVAQSGIGILLVEHNFSLIRLLCDRVTVLDAGKVLIEASAAEVERDAQVLDLYLGSTGARVEPALQL